MNYENFTEDNFSLELSYRIRNKETELHQLANDFTNLSFLLEMYDQNEPRLLESLLF